MSRPPRPSAARAAWTRAGRRRVAWLAGTSALVGLSCSLMVDPDALSGGSDRRGEGGASGADVAAGAAGTAACGADEKLCELDGALRCFSTREPDLGCGAEGCEPCALPHAVAVCGARGLCRIAACSDDTHRDCDAVHENGCEVDIEVDRAHCGACGVECPETPHTSRVTCTRGACAIGACAAGFADCNTTFDDGCEVDLRTSAAHCGACDQPCAGTCADGSCGDEGGSGASP
ncbi:MAG TPA: hypothetical protein PLU22_02330 [Polyangiaceae bacterium]|nr:hypothetical protein [Polyangiaceae bacterium]